MEEEPEVSVTEKGIQDSTSVMGVPTIEEQLNPETSKPTKLNKNGKPRKQLSPDALERLAKAREKANAMRQQNYAKKLEEKVEKLKSKNEVVEQKPVINEEPLTETTNEVSVTEKGITEPDPAEVKEEIMKKVKLQNATKVPKGKKKTKIIIEQSSDDTDEFEPNDNVVFVKRVSRKKKEVPIVPEPKVEMDSTSGMGVLPPPQMPPSKPPELTPQQRLLKSQYEGMFSGGFMNQGNMMRKYY